jgi:hypothetical protein
MRLPRLRRSAPIDERAEWMATAAMYAARLTETGSRCHLNEGTSRFCHWQAEELAASEPAADARVAIRCTIHPGGRFLDSQARLAAEDFAPTRD